MQMKYDAETATQVVIIALLAIVFILSMYAISQADEKVGTVKVSPALIGKEHC